MKAVARSVAPLLSAARRKIPALFLSLLAGCMGVPEDIAPVKNFNLDKYLGRWYEMARLDHPFERGLSKVTADYTRRDDGGVRVLNRGFSDKKKKWKEAEGKAYFAQEPNVGHLKVSFFGPFYGSYVIFDIDEDYRYALVCGPDKSYLWILSRTPTISDTLKGALVEKARESGFDTNKLIFVEQK